MTDTLPPLPEPTCFVDADGDAHGVIADQLFTAEQMRAYAAAALAASAPVPKGEPWGWFHELLDHEGKPNGVFLGLKGANAEALVKQAHTPGETSDEVFPLYAAPSAVPAQPQVSCGSLPAPAALDALEAGAAVEGWRPIETAPHDEDVVLRGRSGAFIGQWGHYCVYNQPVITHWAPLPKPSAEAQHSREPSPEGAVSSHGKTEPTPQAATPAAVSSPPLDDGFEEWWAQYWTSRATNPKALASSAWIAANRYARHKARTALSTTPGAQQ